MEVEVRLFAMLRERAGAGSVMVEIPDGATVADAVDAVGDQHGLGDLIAAMPVVMAVNREYAGADDALSAGDELALIPPVSGGETAFQTGEGYESFMVAIQGGFLTVMLDETMGPGALSALGPGHAVPTLELKVSFLRPGQVGRLVADARVVHLGKSVAFLEASLTDDAGNLIATSTATPRVVRMKDS
jgi:molybdopterin converting factor subunit 1